MEQELFHECVRRAPTFRSRLRSSLRGAFLSQAGMLKRPSPNRKKIQCIMGHYVFDDQRAAFASQLEMLKGIGEFVSTADAVSLVTGSVPLDGNYFHLSFDDGLECLLRNAAPILDHAQIPTLVFVNSAVAAVGSSEERLQWERATNYAKSLRVMTWSQLEASGFEIGAHTRTHQRLSDISDRETLLSHEIAGCKSEIETALGRPCHYFAWPFGRLSDSDETAHNLIKSTGFKAAFSAVRAEIVAGKTDLFRLPRQHFEPQWPLNHLKYFIV